MSTSNSTITAFDTTLTTDARFAGGHITVQAEHNEWLGDDLVVVVLPDLKLYLQPHEARDLAEALQNIATYIDEEVAA